MSHARIEDDGTDHDGVFDHPEHLNEDGSVTVRMQPSNWRCYNISPDTYSTFTSDRFEEQHIEYAQEQENEKAWGKNHAPRLLTYDDFEWTYDHAGIVRAISEVLADWMVEQIMEVVPSARDVKIIETWSPREYNFVSDGFDMEFTCDPAELRAATADFDVDRWAQEYYGHCDGFASFVPRRMQEVSWRAEYDGSFRVESLLHSMRNDWDTESWVYAVWEAEDVIYMDHIQVELIEPEYMDSGFTESQLDAWARDLTPTQPETLFD